MEVTQLLSVCLSALLLSHMVLANPILSRNDRVSDLQNDVADLLQDVANLISDSRLRSRTTADNGRARRTIGLFNAIGNDVRHHRRQRRRRIHPDRRRSRGGAKRVPI